MSSEDEKSFDENKSIVDLVDSKNEVEENYSSSQQSTTKSCSQNSTKSSTSRESWYDRFYKSIKKHSEECNYQKMNNLLDCDDDSSLDSIYNAGLEKNKEDKPNTLKPDKVITEGKVNNLISPSPKKGNRTKH